MATLIMVAKYPQPNKCKTRLAAGIGADGAAAFARVALCDLLERFAGETALGKRVLLFAPLDQREVGFVGSHLPSSCTRQASTALSPAACCLMESENRRTLVSKWAKDACLLAEHCVGYPSPGSGA